MSQPSYKNTLKRSRSSVDAIVGVQDAIQGVAFICGARADGSDVLRPPASSKERTASEIGRIVTGSRNLIDHAFFLPTLARSPSYPFESNKELIRWLLASKADASAAFEQRNGRRRKGNPDHAVDPTAWSRAMGCFPSASALGSSSDVEEMKAFLSHGSSKFRVNVAVDYKSLWISPRGRTDLEPSNSGAGKVTFPKLPQGAVMKTDPNVDDVQQGAVMKADPNVDDVQQCACSSASTTVTDLVKEDLLQRRSCCIARDRCPQFGLMSVLGRRREMEDTFTVEPDFVLLPCNSLGGCQCHDQATCVCSSFHFFGVFDGHGGAQASSFCRTRLHKALTDELVKDVRCHMKSGQCVLNDWSLRWKRVMEACFLKIDEEVGGVCPTGGCSSKEGSLTCCINPIAPGNVGTTAVVAVIGPCQIIVANCGDSRAVLSRGGRAIPLSQDHKPNREDETKRIVAAGGRIIYWEGYRVGGLLAMSRAIGDRYLKKYVIAAPEVICIERAKEDECLILASDGLWDVVNSEVACDLARRRLRSERRKCANLNNPSAEDTPASATAAFLTKFALSKGSRDNITVIIIDLKSYCKKSM